MSALDVASVPPSRPRTRAKGAGGLWWRLLGGAATGAVLALAFPPFGWWPLSLLAVASTTLLVRGVRPWSAAAVGLAVGLVFFLVELRWMLVIGADAWVLLALLEALFVAAMAAGLALVQRLTWWPLWAVCLWVAQEELRAVVPFGGFPWGRLAFAQADSPFRGLAALGGMPVLTFAVALCGSLVAAVAVGLRRRAGVVPGVLLVGAAVAVAVAGLAVPLSTAGRQVTAAVVQGDVPDTGLDAFGQRAAVLGNHVATTEALAADVAAGRAPQPVLVVWPENSTDIDPYADRTAADLIQGAVDAIKAPTLVGAVVDNRADPSTVLNLGIVWAPSTAPGGGGPGQTYAKRHPVPFGEYVPFRSLLAKLVTRFDRVPRDFAAGEHPGVLRLGPVTVGDVICFEVAYDRLVHDVAVADPGLLVVQTNNATYGRTGQPDQQLAISRLRAVETGRTVLVAATSGLSAVVAPDGRLVAVSREFERWTYDGPVTVRSGETLATRLGPWPGLVVGSVGIAAVAAALVRRRRERSRPADASDPTQP